jgi:Transglycosylase-like domain
MGFHEGFDPSTVGRLSAHTGRHLAASNAHALPFVAKLAAPAVIAGASVLYPGHHQAAHHPPQPAHPAAPRRNEIRLTAALAPAQEDAAYAAHEAAARGAIRQQDLARAAAARHARELAAAAARARAAAAQAQQQVQQPVVTADAEVSASGFEGCVIQAESGGDPTAYNPASGASGLFGFLLSTWDSLPASAGYPGGASTAPASVQEEAFQELYAEDGTSPWAPYDGC